jgi:hypothetical protein
MTRFVLQLRRFGVRLTADRRRFGILCMLMAVALLFWTRLIVIKRIPRTALAETELLIAQDSSIDEHDARMEIVTVVLPNQPQRDPFKIDDLAFPVAISDAKAPSNESTTRQADPKVSVAAMRLDASMPPGIAVIDGTTRRRGDSVSGSEGMLFEVIEIRPRSVVLGRAEARYVLRMD